MAKIHGDPRQSLLAAKETAKRRLEQLEVERREIKSSLKSLDAALKALARPRRAIGASPRPEGDVNSADAGAAMS